MKSPYYANAYDCDSKSFNYKFIPQARNKLLPCQGGGGCRNRRKTARLISERMHSREKKIIKLLRINVKQFIFIFSDSLKVGQTNWPHSFFVSCSIKNLKTWTKTTTTTTYSPSTSRRPRACRVWGEGKTRWVMSLLSLFCLLPATAGVCGWQTLLLLWGVTSAEVTQTFCLPVRGEENTVVPAYYFPGPL